MSAGRCRPFTFLFVLLLLCSFSRPADAQVSATMGAIVGTVTDNTKAVMPGVTIAVSGPALMGTRTVVTEADGSYRIPLLPPGQGYTLEIELSGFSKITRKDLVVAGGVTTTVNTELSIAGVTENVTVSGASPVVDVTASNVTTHYDNTLMTAAIGSRDYTALLAAAPGVALATMDVGGSNAITNIGYTAYGLNLQNRGEVEGIYTSENVTGGSDLNYSNFNSFEDFAVNPAGNNAEMPQPGNWSSVISKAGGNMYHGSLYQDYEPRSLEAHNIDAALMARGLMGSGNVQTVDINRLVQFHDFNGDLGGYLKKDKLWWYASHRRTHLGQDIGVITDGPENFDLTIYSEKVTYLLNQNNRISFYNTRGTKLNNNYGIGAPITSSNALWDEIYPTGTISLTYDSVLSKNMVLVARVGDWYDRSFFIGKCDQVPNGQGGVGAGTCGIYTQDVGTNIAYGTHPSSIQGMDRPQANGSLTYFKENWAGSHTIKVGGEFIYDKVHSAAPVFQNMELFLNNGVPSQVQLLQPSTTALKRNTRASGYVEDSWKLNSRLTMNLGVRLDHDRSYSPMQAGPYGLTYPEITGALWNNLGPRLGVVYALTADLKTIVKANYGQYWNNPGPDFSANYTPNASTNGTTYAWNDPNPIYTTALGPYGPIQTPVFVPGQQGRVNTTTGGNPNGTPSVTVDPNLQNSYTRQALVYVEREVAANFGVRTGFVWNGYRQGYSQINASLPFSAYNVPTSFCVPGTDGKVASPSTCPTVTAYNLDAAHLGLPSQQVYTNVPNTDSDWYTWEITAQRRPTGRFSVLAAFSETWAQENRIPGSAPATTSGSSIPLFTPNTLINTVNGRDHFKTWSGKIGGTLDVPYGVRFTPMLRYQSGTPFAPSFTARLNYASVPIEALPYGTGRNDNVTIFDLRAEKDVHVGMGRLGLTKVGLFVDLYNIFNTNAVQAETTTYGPAYLRPTSVTGPRIMRLGAKWSF